MTDTVLWLLALFVLVIAGESAHVRLSESRGVSPIASAAAVAFMLSLPSRPGALGSAVVLAGVAAVVVASLVGTAIAEAAGVATTGSHLLSRVVTLSAGHVVYDGPVADAPSAFADHPHCGPAETPRTLRLR